MLKSLLAVADGGDKTTATLRTAQLAARNSDAWLDVLHISPDAEPMAVFADRGDGKDLRIDLALEVEDQPYRAGSVAGNPHRLDIRVVRGDAVGKLAQCRIDFDAFEIQYQPFGIFNAEQVVSDRRTAFERDARVIGRRPDARRGDL